MTRRNITRGAPPQLSRSSSSHSFSGGGVKGAARPRGRVREGGTDDESGLLSIYFREMSALNVMSAEEELRAALKITSARARLWEALLAEPALGRGICTLIETHCIPEEMPIEQLAAVRVAARVALSRDSHTNEEAYRTGALALAEAIGRIDVDGIIAQVAMADLYAGVRGDLADLYVARSEGEPTQLLTAAREMEPARLAACVQQVRAASDRLRQVKHAFVASNLRLVVSIARRFNHGRMSLQDLIQEGNIGLMKAVDRFDPSKGFRFSTYGSWWIRHAISRAVADKGRAIRLPVHMIDAYQRVGRARREFEAKHGREPTIQELAAATGLVAEKIERMAEMLLDAPMSLDRTISEEDGRRAVDFLEDTDSPQPGDALETTAIHAEVRRLVTNLRPMEADILRKRFGLLEEPELTLKEIGSQYELSRERIRQLQEQALGKIRRELKRLAVV